jgi:hypothetical protein
LKYLHILTRKVKIYIFMELVEFRGKCVINYLNELLDTF